MFNAYKATVSTFKFDFPEGNSVDLADKVEKIIQVNVNDLNNKFADVVNSWLKDINKLIAKETRKSGINDWLQLTYERQPSDPVGILWIEYFECLKFEFHIQSTFRQPEFEDRLDIVYTPNGTKIVNMDTQIPPFNCVRIDKCDPNRPTEILCREVDLQLNISKDLADNNKKLILNAQTPGNYKPTAYLWEVQDGVPAVSNKKNPTFTFRQFEPPIKIIRLAAFTENGCRVVLTDLINLKPD